MTAIIKMLSYNAFRLSWLTGPILEKELRVSSRRRRNYTIRSVYLLLLTFLIAIIWLYSVIQGKSASASLTASRMSRIGTNLTLTVIWFQFCICQILAIVMMSNCISDEINRGTLSVLMTTPITSIQIVLGKLLSKLFQLFLLIGISLSTLAVLRVFGGIQWDYIISSVFITLTAMIFAASLSIFFSTLIRKAYSVIMIIMILVTIQYFIVPLFFNLLGSSSKLNSLIAIFNPFAAMLKISSPAMWGMSAVGSSFPWPLHCSVILAISLIILTVSVIRTRKVMITQAFIPKKNNFSKGVPFVRRFISGKYGGKKAWYEQGGNLPLFFVKHKKNYFLFTKKNIYVILLLITGYFLIYLLLFSQGIRGFIYSSYYTGCIWLVLSLRTVTMAATSITKEKESRTWPILMSTTLDNGQIMYGKAMIVLSRNFAGWFVMAINAILMYFIFYFMQNNINIGTVDNLFLNCILSFVNVVVYMFFLISLGLYLSMRLKSSTTAIISTIAVILGIMMLNRIFTTFVYIFFMKVFPAYSWFFIFNSLWQILLRCVIGVFFLWKVKNNLRKYIYSD